MCTYSISRSERGGGDALSTNPTGTPRSTDVATTHTACISFPATLACSASQSIQSSRLCAKGVGSSNDAERSPGNSSTSPASRSSPSPVPTPITGRITFPLRTERQWSRNRRRLLFGGQRRDGGHERGVDPADTRPAHDLDLLPTRLQRREQDRESAGLICAARPTAGEDETDSHQSRKGAQC